MHGQVEIGITRVINCCTESGGGRQLNGSEFMQGGEGTLQYVLWLIGISQSSASSTLGLLMVGDQLCSAGHQPVPHAVSLQLSAHEITQLHIIINVRFAGKACKQHQGTNP